MHAKILSKRSNRYRRALRLASAPAALALLAGAIAPGITWAAPDASPPTVAVDVPSQDQTLCAVPVVPSGSACMTSASSALSAAIQDLFTRRWLQSDGSFGPWSTRHQNAQLASPGAASTDWSSTFDPPQDGTYGAQTQSWDAAGNESAKIWRRFQVDAGVIPPPPPADAEPTVAVAVPSQDQTFGAVPVVLSGTAADDVGVTRVSVAIQDLVTRRWLQSDGSFGPWSTRHQNAQLASPGAASTDWSYTFDPPQDGTYGAQTQSWDAAGNESAKIWRRFQVDAGVIPPPPPPGSKGYVSIIFSRSQWAHTDLQCQIKPNTVNLQHVAEGLKVTGSCRHRQRRDLPSE